MADRNRCVIWGDDLERARQTADRIARAVAQQGYTVTVTVSGSAPENYHALYPYRGHLDIAVITAAEAEKGNRGGSLRLVSEGE